MSERSRSGRRGKRRKLSNVNDKDDARFMRMALTLAARGRGMTSPNPMVGAVVVKRGRVIAKAYHRQAGTPHAEVLALQAANPKARGGTLYTNLEPCCHKEKRTPPCMDEIFHSGISRVVVGMIDPNPKVNGRGISLMEKAGIKVTTGVLQDQAKRLNEAYVRYITSHTPFVILKTGSSLDGRIATASGESRWITGEKARKVVHQLRASADAVMVGAGTVRSDDPLLTVRGISRKITTPFRIVIDGRLDIPLKARVFDVREAPTMIVTTPAAPAEKVRDLERMGVEVLVQKTGSGRIDLKELMKELGHRGITSVLIEGGAELNASALQEGIVDKVIFFLAPRIIGGRDAVPSVGGQSPARLDLSIPLHDLHVRKEGEDLMVEGYVGSGPNWKMVGRIKRSGSDN